MTRYLAKIRTESLIASTTLLFLCATFLLPAMIKAQSLTTEDRDPPVENACAPTESTGEIDGEYGAEGDLTAECDYTDGDLNVESLTLRYAMGAFFGEPTRSAVFKWEGSGSVSNVNWGAAVVNENGEQYLIDGNPVYAAWEEGTFADPGEGFGIDVTGSPSWDATFLFFDETEEEFYEGISEEMAKEIYTEDYLLQDLFILGINGNSLSEGGNDGGNSDTTPPTAPTSLSVSAAESGIELSWDANSEDDLAGYNLYRSESSFSDVSSATKVNSSLITDSPYTDDSVEEGVTYFYRATAVDTADNESDPSDIVEIENPSTPIAAPTNLTASSDSSGIKLFWDENSETDLEGYNVYRATQSFSTVSEANQLNESLLTEASFEDIDVTSGTTYYYAVTAVDQDQNESALSDLAEITFEDNNSGSDGGDDAILTEDFEDAQFPPDGWSTQTSISSELWFLFDHNDGGFEPVDDQSRYSAMVDWVDEDHDEWLISPGFSLSETDSTVLIFDVYYDAVWVSDATIKLNILTGQSDSDWTTLWEAEDDGTSKLRWRKVEVDLSDYAGTDNVQLAWQYVGNNGYIMAIDNIEISTGEAGSGDNLPTEVAADAQITFGEARTSQDYRLVALPGAVNENLETILSGDPNVDWQAYYDDGSEDNYLVKYDGGDSFTFQPGNGFWVTHQDSFVYQDTLLMVEFNSQDQAMIPLHEGWNIISNPLDIDVAWSEITSVNGDSLQPVWGFDGSFTEASDFASARSGEAFYFLNDQGLDELVIPYVQTSAKEQELGRKKQLSLMTFVNGNQTSSNSIVFTEDRQNRQIDIVAPPDAFEGSSLRFVNKETSEDNRRTASLARIYREYQPQGQRFTMTLTAKPDQPVTINAEGLDSYHLQELVILNPETGRSFDLLSNKGVTITPKEQATKLLLVMGDSQFVGQQQDEFLPKRIKVNPNYPNPFNPTTTLRFSLPEQADVRVQVYDILGRQVSTLVNEVREAGIHTVTFDASRQASGMYFAIFEIGQQRYIQKMMLIK